MPIPSDALATTWPRVGDQRMAVGLAPFVADRETAGLRGSADIGLRLDRARAEQRFPMVLAGLQGERRRQRDHLGALVGERLEQAGKAQIVADRAADRDAFAIVGDDRVARFDRLALPVGGAVGVVTSKRWILR